MSSRHQTRRKIEGDRAWTANREIFLPDRKITKLSRVFNYIPLRGYAGTLAVFDAHDKCIGWIDTRALGYENAKAWMAGVRWIDQGF